MKQLIAKYKQYVDAGYGREQIADMLDKENITSDQKEFILNTLFKKKP